MGTEEKIIEGLIHDKINKRFLLLKDGVKEGEVFVSYVEREGYMYLTHSEVPASLRGQGIGKELVSKTFDYIKNQDIKAKAFCSYIAKVKNESNYYSQFIG